MVLLDITYNKLQFAEIKDPVNFFKTGAPGVMIPLRTLYNNTKLLWNLGSDQVLLSVAQGQNIYRITLLSKNKRTVFGSLIYIPELKRLDLYTSESPTVPLIQWKGQKVMYKTYPYLLDSLGLDKMFSRIIAIL